MSGASNATDIKDELYFGGGVALGDIDGDGLDDIFIDSGDIESAKLYRNLGDGRFENIAAEAGVALASHLGSGPTFADVNGDGRVDLFIGGLDGHANKLFINVGNSQFQDATADANLTLNAPNTYSAAFGDYNLDGFLDLALSHWGNAFSDDTETLFEGTGTGSFVPASQHTGIASQLLVAGSGGVQGDRDYTFTPTFADFNNDGWPDLAMVADFKTSKYFLNDQQGKFVDATNNQLTDDSGMGSAIGDYDNDGDLDWFITSIYETSEHGIVQTGNRLFSNNLTGFGDQSFVSRIEDGGWAWGACFADFNNDGLLDIFHTNGWVEPSSYDPDQHNYPEDQSRLFMAKGGGRFEEQAMLRGLTDEGQGRGVACFDADNDGDVDLLLVSNERGHNAFTYYENQNGNAAGNFLALSLVGSGANTQAAGARVYVTAGGVTQMRELMIGSNFTSQNSTQLHFGLGESEVIEALKVRWPDGAEQEITPPSVNSRIQLVQP
ncbi:CRTAC1 family protein [Simiduia sp. 21SJ11W-1]|nr:CRTAC1 family protein [Simiduia sp. 21SJ11W-1]